MTKILSGARRRPWHAGIGGAVAVTIGAALVFVAVPASAAPPANDSCAAPQELLPGQALEGATFEAVDDYQALLLPEIEGAPTHAAPADGSDAVFTLAMSEEFPIAEVVVSAPFRASIYAFPVVEGDDFFHPSNCGHAFGVPGLNIAGAGAHLRLFNIDEDGTTWFIVVDGWTASDKGPFTIVAAVSGPDGEANDEAAIISSIQARIAAAEERLSDDVSAVRDEVLDLKTQVETLQTTLDEHDEHPGRGPK